MTYAREQVEALLEAVYDKGAAWGMVDQHSPDPDMPKAVGLKNRGNTLWAHLADIRRAWHRTDLTDDERRAALLIGGMGYSHTEAAHVLNSERRTVSYRYERAVGKLCDFLNGTSLVQD